MRLTICKFYHPLKPDVGAAIVITRSADFERSVNHLSRRVKCIARYTVLNVSPHRARSLHPPLSPSAPVWRNTNGCNSRRCISRGQGCFKAVGIVCHLRFCNADCIRTCSTTKRTFACRARDLCEVFSAPRILWSLYIRIFHLHFPCDNEATNLRL